MSELELSEGEYEELRQLWNEYIEVVCPDLKGDVPMDFMKWVNCSFQGEEDEPVEGYSLPKIEQFLTEQVPFKVVVSPPVTEDDLRELQRRGCMGRPYLSTASRLLFRADVEVKRVHEIRQLPFVFEVEPMPTYGF